MGFKQQLLEMLEGRRPGPEWIEAFEIKQLLVGFDGGEGHPVEGEQQHQKDDRKRQIESDKPPRQCLQIAHAFSMIGNGRAAVEHGPWVGYLRCNRVSHCFRLVAICAAAIRTRRSGSQPAGMGSLQSRLPNLRRDSRRRWRADSRAWP